MIQTLKNLFGLGPKTDYKTLLQQGAEIIDVRTKGEFVSGHIKGSKNIPLNTIGNQNHLKDKGFPEYDLTAFCRPNQQMKLF